MRLLRKTSWATKLEEGPRANGTRTMLKAVSRPFCRNLNGIVGGKIQKCEGSVRSAKIVPNLFSFNFNDTITVRPVPTTRAVLLPATHHFYDYATLLLFLQIFLTFFVPFNRCRQIGKTSTRYELIPLKTSIFFQAIAAPALCLGPSSQWKTGGK